jgi:hypothetical protein
MWDGRGSSWSPSRWLCVSACLRVCLCVKLSLYLSVCICLNVCVCLCVFPCRPIHWQNMCCLLSYSAAVVRIYVALMHAGVVLSFSDPVQRIRPTCSSSAAVLLIHVDQNMCWRVAYECAGVLVIHRRRSLIHVCQSLIHLCISKARCWRWQYRSSCRTLTCVTPQAS